MLLDLTVLQSTQFHGDLVSQGLEDNKDLRSGKMIGMGSEREGLYYLDQPRKGTCNSVQTLASNLWHQRRGHPSNKVFHYTLPVSTCHFSESVKMGAALGKDNENSGSKPYVPESKLEAKMVKAMQQRESEGTAMKSFNSLILKFPKIDKSLRKCKAIFEQFDEDSNGAIDPEELKHCFHKLEISFSEEEIGDLFQACDINEDMGMKFNEFIVLLCLAYLLKEDPTALQAKSQMGLQDFETTFETLVDAFVFLDKNKDGYVSKNEMVQAINETTAGERSSGRIAMKRFEEMDWDRNGMVTFKEFLFAFTRWIGIDDLEDVEGIV